jgi:N-acetylglucosaminyltransferase
VTFLPISLLVLVVFANRYFAGSFFKRLRPAAFAPVNERYEPTVTVVVPLFNEGEGIYRTVRSLLDQQYPHHKLSIIVVDDCSTDDSYAWASRAAAEHPDRVRVIKNPHNMGKRRGIIRAVREAEAEIIVSVDSDVVVEKNAVQRLVRRFVRDELAAVGGRVNISNANDGWLTRMQTIKYYLGYEYLKNLERAFSSVMCLSGCLTAYRRSVLLELEPILEKRAVLGVPITYGEDRFLTRQIVKAGYQTTSTLDAVCWTVAPNTLSKYMAQQLRWRRSNLIDFMMGVSHAWRLHPLVGLHYLSLFAMLLVYPIVVALHVWSGAFFQLAVVHLATLGVFGIIYYFDTRSEPAERRVHPLWFMAMAAVMPVTYLLFTPLAMFTLDSSSWETRSHGGAQGARLGARLVTSLNKLIVSVYKAVGFAVLGGVVVGLACYLGLHAFYAVNHSWMAPAIIAPGDARVHEASARVVQQAVLGEKLAAERRELGLRIDDGARTIAAEELHRTQLISALGRMADARDAELAALRGVQRGYRRTQKNLRRASRDFGTMSKQRLAELHAAHLIDQDGLLNGQLQLAQLAQNDLTLAERRALIDARVDALGREVAALRALTSPAADLSKLVADLSDPESLALHRELVQADLALARLRGEKTSLEQSASGLDAQLGRQRALVTSLESDPLLEAAEHELLVAFVPYDNLGNVRPGQPIYGCKLGFVWCEPVGKVSESFAAERTLEHPLWHQQLRGQLVAIRLDAGRWGERSTLFAGRAPLWL